jgi:SSS family solute:Na+ symporter
MSILTILSFIGFTALVAIISFYKTRGNNPTSGEGYFLGGRSLTGIVIAASMMLTNLSTEQLVGLNGVAFSEGLVCMAWEVVASLALVILALGFLPRYLAGGLTTVPQFLENRYDKTTRTITSILFLSGYVTIFLPIVLYSGSLAVVGIFDLTTLLNIDHTTAIWFGVWGIGIIGSLYVILGGLKLIAVSDTINGIGLIIGGFMIPFLGIQKIGNGNFFAGLSELFVQNSDKFNTIGTAEQSVPFSTLFTGMILVNVFYWCTNQAIVQKTLGAKNLEEGQKGALYAGLFKLLGPIILVLPGIVAFHLFKELPSNDLAYPTLVKAVLPPYLVGFFAAVLVGAIFSSFNGALNSASTLFSVGVYKQYINKEASDLHVVKAGRVFGTVVAIISMAVAPLIMYAPQGLFGYLQQVNGCYSIPILTIIVVGMLTKKVPPIAAKIGLISGVVLYILSQFIFKVELHFLHVMAILFVLNVLIMLIIGKFWPMEKPYVPPTVKTAELRPWKYAVPTSVFILFGAISLYALGSKALRDSIFSWNLSTIIVILAVILTLFIIAFNVISKDREELEATS